MDEKPLKFSRDGGICNQHPYASLIKMGCVICRKVEKVPNVDFTESRIKICEHSNGDLVHICDK